jgi:hypothetical protein
VTRLFLDCEWADTQAEQLVSLALVDAAGEHRFYTEIYPLPAHPTDFVQHVVYPLLDHGWFSMPDHEITRQLRAFLAKVPQPISVLFDNPEDGRLFRDALEGFAKFSLDSTLLVTSPEPGIVLLDAALEVIKSVESGVPEITTTLVTFGDVLANIESYFEARPAEAARRHHALVDAQALAWAFAEAMKGGSA